MFYGCTYWQNAINLQHDRTRDILGRITCNMISSILFYRILLGTLLSDRPNKHYALI